MKNEPAPTPATVHTAILDEAGFAAMLRRDDLERDLAGIIGGPRVNPTGSGLWIEDSLPAAIGEITIVLLEDFLRREKADRRFVLRGETHEGAGTTRDAMSQSARAPNSRAPARAARSLV